MQANLYKVTIDNILEQYFPVAHGSAQWSHVKGKTIQTLVDEGILELDCSELPSYITFVASDWREPGEIAFTVAGLTYEESVKYLHFYRNRYRYLSTLSGFFNEIKYYLDLLKDEQPVDKQLILKNLDYVARQFVNEINNILSEEPIQ